MTGSCSRCGCRVRMSSDFFSMIWIQDFDGTTDEDFLPVEDTVLCPICRKDFDGFMKKQPNSFR